MVSCRAEEATVSRLAQAWLLLLANITIWCVVGYRTGEAIGRGWRGALVDDGCAVCCGRVTITAAKGDVP
jgi:hypothetical protein